MNRKRLWGVGSCCALALACGGVQGAVIAVEQFVYPVGTPMPAMGGCCGWSAPWVGSNLITANPPTMAYPLALPSAGIAAFNPAAGEGWRTLPGGVTNFGNDLWVSWMEKSAVAGSGAFVSLDPPGAGFGTLQVFKDAAGNVFASLGGGAVPVGPSSGVASVDFFVARIRQFSGGTTVVDLYLNPTAVLPIAPVSVTLVSPLPFALARYYYRSDGGQWLDEIRIGTLPGDVAASIGGSCYANCDQSTTPPCLNVLDFSCFLNRFAAGDPYANCDGSTTPPVLNVLDFSCFLNRFAAGCSNC